MNNDITQSIETLLKKHSHITGSFVKKAISEELALRQKDKSDYRIICEGYEDLVNWIMVELGHPVIHLGLDAAHYQQAIYAAIELWWQHHYDGSYVEYQAISVTQSMIDNNEITIDMDVESILSAKVVSSAKPTEPVMFSDIDWYEYDQRRSFNMSSIHSNMGSTHGSAHAWSDIPLGGVLALEMHIGNMNSLFKKNVMYRYHRYENKLKFLDTTLKKICPGSLVLIEVYKNVDPNEVSSLFNDIWIKKYSMQKVKQMWGTILKNIKNIPLIAGQPISGDEMYEEATREIEKLEIELVEKYEHPPMFYWG